MQEFVEQDHQESSLTAILQEPRISEDVCEPIYQDESQQVNYAPSFNEPQTTKNGDGKKINFANQDFDDDRMEQRDDESSVDADDAAKTLE